MNKDQLKRLVSDWILRIFLLLATVVFLYPFVWNIFSSFKTNTEYLTDPYALPQGIHFENYVNAIEKANMAAYFLNSIFIVVLSTAILLVFVVPAAYVLARYTFKGSKAVTTLYMACIFLQPTYIMIPLFLELQAVDGLNNRVVLSLVYAVMQFPFALVILTDETKKTLPIGLANLFEVQKFATDWGALFAGLILVLIPTVAIYLIGQKQLLAGISVGGLKG